MTQNHLLVSDACATDPLLRVNLDFCLDTLLVNEEDPVLFTAFNLPLGSSLAESISGFIHHGATCFTRDAAKLIARALCNGTAHLSKFKNKILCIPFGDKGEGSYRLHYSKQEKTWIRGDSQDSRSIVILFSQEENENQQLH